MLKLYFLVNWHLARNRDVFHITRVNTCIHRGPKYHELTPFKWKYDIDEIFQLLSNFAIKQYTDVDVT